MVLISINSYRRIIMDTQTRTIQMLSEEVSKSKDVVASFKLSQESMDAMVWIAKRLGISNKKLFDAIWSHQGDSFIMITNDVEYDPNIKRKKISKRISRQSLNNLNELSKKYEMKRDQIIEVTFISYQLLLEKILNDRKNKHKKANKMIDEYWKTGELLEKKLKNLLDEDDPIIDRIGYVIVVIMNLSSAIQSELKDGIQIDPDDYSQSC